MTAPKRIQRKRTKGWRMPEGAVYVGRPTRWGNPFVGDGALRHYVNTDNPEDVLSFMVGNAAGAVALFRGWAEQPFNRYAITRELAGLDLACWCPLDQPCHADVLLELANGGA